MGEPFVHEVRVPWGDVDLSTTIYYPRAFHYFEAAIEEFFRSRGLRYGSFARTGVMLARVAASAEYKAPIHFHDLLSVSVRLARIGRSSVTFGLEAKKDGQVAVRGTSTGVAVRWGEWRPVEVPQPLRDLLGPPASGPSLPEPRPVSGPPKGARLATAVANGRPRTNAGTHRWRTRVHAGDVDLAQILYYPTLFHFFEQSIEDLFRAVGAPYRGKTVDTSLTFPRVSVRGEFLAPIRVGDLLTFEVGVGRIGTTSITFVSRAMKENGSPAARAEVTAVTLDKAAWRPVPVPDAFRERLKPVMIERMEAEG